MVVFNSFIHAPFLGFSPLCLFSCWIPSEKTVETSAFTVSEMGKYGAEVEWSSDMP